MAHFLDEVRPRDAAASFSEEDMQAIVRARSRGVSWKAIYEAFNENGRMPYKSAHTFRQLFPNSKPFQKASKASE